MFVLRRRWLDLPALPLAPLVDILEPWVDFLVLPLLFLDGSREIVDLLPLDYSCRFLVCELIRGVQLGDGLVLDEMVRAIIVL